MTRGFGVSAAIDPDLTGALAAAAETAGYATFWVNDVPGGNGLEQLKRAQEATSTIRLGVGVLPVDRWSAEQIATTIQRLALDSHRLDVGIGAGALHAGSLAAVESCAASLKHLTTARVLVGSLGPKMVALGGAAADGVILNWLTPEAAEDLALVARDASSGGTHVVAYVRTASSREAEGRLRVESEAYEGYPSYKRHFDRMGVRAIDTTICGNRTDIGDRFTRFDRSVDEVVCRAITASESLTDYLEVLAAAAPDGGAH